MKRLVVTALLLAATAVARADDFSGRATAGYNQVRSSEQNTDSFAQIYDLRYERLVTPVLLYRLALRAEDDLGTVLIDDVRLDHETRELRPVAQLQWNRPSLSLQLGYDLTWSQAITEGRDTPSRLLQRAALSIVGRPSTDLSLTGDAQWRLERLGDEADSSDVRGGFLLTLKRPTLTLTGGGNGNFYRAPLKDFSRVGVGLLGSAAWTESYDDGTSTLGASNTANWLFQNETSRSGMTVDDPRRELPAAALHAIDNTPDDSRDVPLLAVPALLDGDLATPTEINLGPLGVDHQALGVDLGRFVVIDELRVHVRNEAGNTVPRGGDIHFEVWTSVDARDWQRHEGMPTVAFLVASSSYAVRFPELNTRYAKIVTFGVNSIDTRVTEVEVYRHVAFTPEEDRVSHTFVDSVQLTFTYKPSERVTFSYTGLLNLSLQTDNRGDDVSGFDWAQSCSLSARLARSLEAQAGVDSRGATRLGALTGLWTTVTAQLTATPTAAVTASARGAHGATRESSGDSTDDEARFALHTRILPSLDSSLDLGAGRQRWEPPLARTVDRTFLSWVANAQLFRPLRVTGNVALQRAETTLDGRTDSTAEKDYRAYGEASWRVSQMLLVAARLGWAEGTRTSGLLQRYRLDWHPLPGGALVLGFSYDEDQQSSSGYRSRRLSIFPSWTVNGHMSLNLNYTLVELKSPEGLRKNELFYVLLTLNT